MQPLEDGEIMVDSRINTGWARQNRVQLRYAVAEFHGFMVEITNNYSYLMLLNGFNGGFKATNITGGPHPTHPVDFIRSVWSV